jgi:putative SOS response-associated peptidase YedK
MCGRYATTRSQADLAALFEAADETGDSRLEPDYNVAPTDPVPIVAASANGGRALRVARWGLLPHWARDARAAARMINARAETVATSSAFATSFTHRRCLVPADGWYEWVRGADGRRQPYFMTARDGRALAFAGIWAVWGAGDERRLTCSIVTTAAVGGLAFVHARMPLLLPPARWASWLRATAQPRALLAPPPEEYLAGLEIRPVGVAVGDVHNDGPSLVARVDAPPPERTAVPVDDLTLF